MDNGDGELTDVQTELMLHFQDFTGIDDINVCRDVLTRHQWDLEIAIQEQLNINEGRPTMFAAAADDARAPQVLNDQFMQTVFSSSPLNAAAAAGGGGGTAAAAAGAGVLPSNAAPVPIGGAGGLAGLIGYFVNYLFGLCYSSLATLASTLFGLFAPDERRIVTDPLGDVTQSIRAYNDKYGVEHPVFYQGTYAQALNDAKRELKFLAVYLHSEQSNGTEVAQFCRHTLANRAVVEYVSRNMLWWGCDVSTPEGFRVSHSVAARAYPLIVVVGLRSNKMMVMGRLEGACGPEELVRRLRLVVEENEVWLNQARAERLERSLTQSLRQQQDEAYEVSLRADQEKERLRLVEQERRRAEQQAVDDELRAEQDRKQEIARQKIELATQVPDEPAQSTPGALIVLFKLPSGQRVERRFMSTDSLRDVYNFIFCHPASPDYFELTTNFPKRVLQTKDSSADQTLAQAGVQNREVLFVNDLEA